MRAAAVLAMVAAVLVGLALPGARAPPPGIAILSPADGTIVGDGAAVVVAFSVTDFALVQPGRVGQVPAPAEGHVRVLVDGALDRVLDRVEPILLELPSGPHVIRLQLAGNDGAPLVPDASAQVSVTVTRGPATGQPAVAITYPPYDLRTGHDVYVAVRVENFSLVSPDGRPNAPNEGHLVFLLNGEYHTQTVEQAAFFVDLPDGYDTFTVRLVNNDGTPLTPDVTASTRVYIKGANPTVSEAVSGGLVLLLLALLAAVARRRLAGHGRKSGGEGGGGSPPVE
jgi:hypothetical protein